MTYKLTESDYKAAAGFGSFVLWIGVIFMFAAVWTVSWKAAATGLMLALLGFIIDKGAAARIRELKRLKKRGTP